jgi:type VI secretion system protein ImpK
LHDLLVHSPTALDLLARLHAQRGDLDDADRYWSRAEALSDTADHPTADNGPAAGRRTIADIRAGRRRPRPLWRPARVAAVGTALLGVAVAGTIAAGLGAAGADGPDPRLAAAEAAAASASAAAASAAADAAAADRRRAALESERTAAEAARSAAAARTDAALDDILRRVTVPGVVVERRPADVRLRFEVALFTEGDRVTRRGAALLATLGGRLVGLPVTVTVVGHVVPVPGGRTSGGSALALSRAEVAARELARGGLPWTAFTLVGADQSDPPFPDPNRNRTVTLVVTPSS